MDREKKDITEEIIKQYPHGIINAQLSNIIQTTRLHMKKVLNQLLKEKRIVSKKMGRVTYYFKED